MIWFTNPKNLKQKSIFLFQSNEGLNAYHKNDR